MKIYVISLESAVDRRKKIKKIFKDLKLDFEFFNAVDGRYGFPEEYNPLVDWDKLVSRLGEGVTDVEVSVALSHAMVYKRMVRLGIENAIVLEDDVILGEDFKEMITSQSLEKSNKDFVLLYHLYAKALYFSKEDFLDKKYNLVKLARSPNGAAAYYLNLKMANFLFNTILPISYVADWGVNLTELNSAAVVPRIVCHPAMDDSYIEQARTTRKAIFRYGVKEWFTYKFKKPFSYNISAKIEGK